jgi:hypothetical protein
VVNVLDFTACGVPVTEVRKDIDQYDGEEYVPLNELDKLVHDDCEYLFLGFAGYSTNI